MNERKLQSLFNAARADTPPAPGPDFETSVLRAVRRAAPAPPETLSLLDQLGVLFPRLATVAAVLIGLCVAADFGLAALEPTTLAEGVTQVSEQWLFADHAF